MISCKEENLQITKATMEGYWLGGALEIDKGVYRPNPSFFEIRKDGTMSYLGMETDTVLKYSISQDSFHFPFRKVPLREIQRFNNNLIMGKFYPAHYLKLNPIPLDLDTLEIMETLVSSKWKSKLDYLSFDFDSLIVHNFRSEFKEKLCWKIHEYEGSKFLQRRGNWENCEAPHRFLEYIKDFSSEGFTVIRWEGLNFNEIYYARTEEPEPEFEYPEFKLCNPFINRNYGADRYYFKYTGYEGGLYQLRKIFDKKYVPVKEGSRDGIVKIEFVVNCMGEIGNFEILELSNDYKKIELNSRISEQLLEILKSAGNWIPGERRGLKTDTYKFVSFKIRDGKIFEIFP